MAAMIEPGLGFSGAQNLGHLEEPPVSLGGARALVLEPANESFASFEP
jgi:hypothetical protein